LLACAFPVELGVPGIPVRMRDLVELEPGRVLVLPRPATTPARVIVAGQESFTATVARTDKHRAGMVIEPLDTTSGDRRKV
jgi:flagellar motor switch protein FliM